MLSILNRAVWLSVYITEPSISVIFLTTDISLKKLEAWASKTAWALVSNSFSAVPTGRLKDDMSSGT